MYDGSPLMTNCVIHDHEDAGFGAQSIMTIGDMGTGKTTLMQRILQRVTHLDSANVSKNDYLSFFKSRQRKERRLLDEGGLTLRQIGERLPKLPCKEVPETVIYSAREFDYWHNFLEKRIWQNEFPEPKPVYLHLPRGEEFHFIVPFAGSLKDMDISGFSATYKDSKELISHIKEGAINVFYPPAEYYFPSDILEESEIKKGGSDIEGSVNPKWLNFDLLYHCMQYRYQKFVTFFVDEIHSLIPGVSAGLEWHVLDWFSRYIDPELRRCHISLMGTTHSCTLVDPRHLQRATWFVWTGGAVPHKKYSIVTAPAALRCNAGRCIIERKGAEFGEFYYDRLTGQLPKLRAIRGGLDKASIKSL